MVHGFPILIGGLDDKPLIRSMRETESWFHDVDKKRLHSLPDTSAHLVTVWLTCKKEKKTPTDIHPRHQRLTTSLHSLEKGSFVSPGWEDLATSLPILQEEDEGNLLEIMLEELNFKFATAGPLSIDGQVLSAGAFPDRRSSHQCLLCWQ